MQHTWGTVSAQLALAITALVLILKLETLKTINPTDFAAIFCYFFPDNFSSMALFFPH